MPMHNSCGCAGPSQFYTADGTCCLGVQAGSRTHCALPAALSRAGRRHGAAPWPLLAPALPAVPLVCAPAPQPRGDVGSQAVWTRMHNSPGHRAAVPTAVLPAPPAQAWPHSIALAAPALLWDGDGDGDRAGDGDAPCRMPSTAVGAGRTLCTSSLSSYPATKQPGQGASCLQLLIKTYARRSAIKLSLQCYA